MTSILEKGGGTFAGIKMLIKPLNDRRLGPGYMLVTTALPDENRRFLEAMRVILG